MISAVTFCYNEAPKIEDSLKALKGNVDEIIVFDLESTDETNIIACKYADIVKMVPYLLCGDSYKQSLHDIAKGDWLLWWYPDEVFSENTARDLRQFTLNNLFNTYCFMRREFMDGVRIGYNKDGRVFQFGTNDSPNYQRRLIRKQPDIFYTEMVHAEVHGKVVSHSLPCEYYMEHRKSSRDQELDNIRLYIWYKFLTFKYGETKVQPYREYVASYRQIVKDSEKKNLSGERKISLMEEFWWNWRTYAHLGRITLQEFNNMTGVPYEEFIRCKDTDLGKKIIIEEGIRDRILEEMK